MKTISKQLQSTAQLFLSARQSKAQAHAATSEIPREAPHPIPKGMENRPCPITGFIADGRVLESSESAASTEALLKLLVDPDIASESRALKKPSSDGSRKEQLVAAFATIVPLNVYDRAHHASAATRALVRSIGGLPTLRRFTNRFYELAFSDPHLDKFIANHEEPHGERFANWIAEKMGDGTPWTDERKTRPIRKMNIFGKVYEVAHDRSSAHFAAWHSPKREQEKWGDHFNVEDSRIWMRLHFLAARETGMFAHEAFMEYYIRFIGHFVSVYSSRSPPFARESARWSANPANVQAYFASGNRMTDVIGQPVERALRALPSEERLYTGSSHASPAWPYEIPPQRTERDRGEPRQ